jgi:predicted urease superfamily metal-dependent hydrolase
MSLSRPAYPIFDNHFHLDPDGRKAEAVKEFVRAGVILFRPSLDL